MTRKVAILIDGVSLFHGLARRTLSFNTFKDWLADGDEVVFAGYFNSVNNKLRKKQFFDHVARSGFTLYIRSTYYNSELGRQKLYNVTSDMIAEGLAVLDKVDKLIIVSGKADLLTLVEKYRLSSKQVEVVQYLHNNHSLLDDYTTRHVSDYFKHLEKKYIYK